MTRIDCTWIDGKDAFVLNRAYAVNLNSHGDNGFVVVPAGFVCDGASIPNWLHSTLFISPFHHTVRRAALVHDYLYSIKMDRAKADVIFRNLCNADGTNCVQVFAMYLAIRLFGWIRY